MNRFDLSGKKGLIIGIANQHSIAYGCAKAIKAQGAELALSYLNDKAKPYVEPLAKELDADILLKCNVTNTEDIESLFLAIKQQWGKLDFLIHSIAFAPIDDLHGRLIDCSLSGFLVAMDVSCHSLMRLCKTFEPIMSDGSSIIAMSYIGSERAIKNYNVMGPVKAALESSVRYLAYELGESGIRAYAVSPGPIATRAASGLSEFDTLLEESVIKSPLKNSLSIDDVGSLSAFLVSDAAQSMTGNVFHIDCGYHIV